MLDDCMKRRLVHQFCVKEGLMPNISAVDYILFLSQIDRDTSISEVKSAILVHDPRVMEMSVSFALSNLFTN